MTIRELSCLERTAAWLDELIDACQPRGRLSHANPNLVRDVTRKAKALRTSLASLRESLIPNGKENPDGTDDR
jgi:hypothetical protein